MALSNIFNEPRREIIETSVGMIITIGIISIIGGLAFWLNGFQINKHLPSAVALILLMMIMFGLGCMIIHTIGEEFCNWLQNRHNIHLRPKQRL